MYYKSNHYKIFSFCNNVFLLLIAFTCVAPLIHVLAISFSGKAAAGANLVYFWPVDFTAEAYKLTMKNSNFVSSVGVSVLRTVLGTSISMIIIVLAAYPLSRDNRAFKGRSFFSFYFLITMMFNGGIIPTYILITKLHLMGKIWALVLPSAVSVWNIILMMNFFRTVPKELEEASLIDGAGHFRTLFSIFLPISMPAIATLSLFTIVWHWNSWFDGLIYMTRNTQYPLATFLQTVIVQHDLSKITADMESLKNYSERTVKAAQIFIAMVPILVVYPFLQKYFVKGMVLGSVKE